MHMRVYVHVHTHTHTRACKLSLIKTQVKLNNHARFETNKRHYMKQQKEHLLKVLQTNSQRKV